MTISGVKKLVKSDINQLDDHKYHGLQADYFKKSIKYKSKELLEKINRIKRYGKKNSS